MITLDDAGHSNEAWTALAQLRKWLKICTWFLFVLLERERRLGFAKKPLMYFIGKAMDIMSHLLRLSRDERKQRLFYVGCFKTPWIMVEAKEAWW